MNEKTQTQDNAFDPTLVLVVLLLVLVWVYIVSKAGNAGAAIQGSQVATSGLTPLEQRMAGYDFSDCAQPG
jgi:hypothetical protein